MQMKKIMAIGGLAGSLFWSGWTLAQGLNPVQTLPSFTPAAASQQVRPAFDFHGGISFWYYRPQQSWVDENFTINNVYLTIDSTFQDFGAHVESRFRDIKFRGYYPSNFWFQEAYAYYRQPNYVIKVGKEYSHFGKFWDGSYYGNVLYYDGIILDPDNGFSFEGQLNNLRGWQANYYLQYFVVDGTTNGSLDPWGEPGEGGLDGQETGSGAPVVYDGSGNSYQTGRDVVSVQGAHRRNQIIARFEPTFAIGRAKLTAGINYEYLLDDVTDADKAQFPAQRLNVTRYAADLTLNLDKWSIFFEWAGQNGLTAVDFPLYLQSSKYIDYYWAGANYKFGKYTIYYNYSDGLYHEQDIHDITQVPGISCQFNKYMSGAFEYGYWYRTHSGNFSMNDNSLNLVVRADF